MIEVQSNKSGNPPIPLFLHQAPFSGLSPLSSKKFRPLPPQKKKMTQFLEGPTPPFNKGGSNYAPPAPFN